MIDIDESTLNNVFEYILKRCSEATKLYNETIKFWDENKDNKTVENKDFKTRDYQEQILAKIRKAEICIKLLTEDLNALKYSFVESGSSPIKDYIAFLLCDLRHMFSQLKLLEYACRMKKSLNNQEE